MNKIIIIIIGIIIAVIVGFVIFNLNKGDNGSAVSQENQETEFTGEVKEFDIIAKQWEFIPGIIEVNKGDLVKLHIKSVDVTHGFAILEFDINKRLEPGEDVHVEFVADKVGIFNFYCTVPCGPGHSEMSGKLVVK